MATSRDNGSPNTCTQKTILFKKVDRRPPERQTIMSDQTIEQRLDDIKEATKRFCRTDEAADNLAKYILQLLNEARIDEHTYIAWRPSELKFIEAQADRLSQLTPRENK